MMLMSLEEILAGAASGIGRRWIAKLRASENLKFLNTLSEGELLSVHEAILRELARWMDRSADKNELGGFFVMMAKDYCAEGVPLSELTFALMLGRKSVTEHILEEEELEGALRIYTLMETVNMVADFFLLGVHYLTKGYLEGTFLRVMRGENISTGILTKYFPDDFFFKD